MDDRRFRVNDETDVTVYWRPGCPFCAGLMRSLDDVGLTYLTRNIWLDEDDAAFVRSVARGNETVPTVAVGDVALVNPTARDVLAAVAEELPERLPADYEPPTPGPLARALHRLLGGG